MDDLLSLVEKNNVAAPAPIEQRWTASSAAPMSPAYSSDPSKVHSWVGIIMYLPTDEPTTRAAISSAFQGFTSLCERQLMGKYHAKWHWAKLELGEDRERLEWVRRYLKEHYDVQRFNLVRHALDPENNLGNDWLNAVLPLTRV
jgi:L-galactono-1,4-lactone dehydrogenase